MHFQKRPRSRSLSQLPDDCMLACRKTSLLNEKKDNSKNNVVNSEVNDVTSEKMKNKVLKSSRNEKADSDTSDDERMVICEEDMNSGKKYSPFFCT